MLARLASDLGVELDGRDLPARSDQLGQERRVVACARADLQYTHPRRHLQLLQHQRDDRWLRGGADRHAAFPVRRHGRIGVGLRGCDLGQKEVPWHAR